MKRNLKEMKAFIFLTLGGLCAASIFCFIVKDFHSAFVSALIATVFGVTLWAQGTLEELDR